MTMMLSLKTIDIWHIFSVEVQHYFEYLVYLSSVLTIPILYLMQSSIYTIGGLHELKEMRRFTAYLYFAGSAVHFGLFAAHVNYVVLGIP